MNRNLTNTGLERSQSGLLDAWSTFQRRRALAKNKTSHEAAVHALLQSLHIIKYITRRILTPTYPQGVMLQACARPQICFALLLDARTCTEKPLRNQCMHLSCTPLLRTAAEDAFYGHAIYILDTCPNPTSKYLTHVLQALKVAQEASEKAKEEADCKHVTFCLLDALNAGPRSVTKGVSERKRRGTPQAFLWGKLL